MFGFRFPTLQEDPAGAYKEGEGEEEEEEEEDGYGKRNKRIKKRV